MHAPTPADIDRMHATAWATLAGPGDWYTGGERLAIARQARAALDCDLCARRAAALTPSAITDAHEGDRDLDPVIVDTIHRVAVDAKRLTRAWAEDVISRIGEGRYVELIGLVASVTMLDMYRRSMDEPIDPLPGPASGEPLRAEGADVGDVGAWVRQTVEKRGANVSRALSLVPETERLFVTIESWQYSRDFKDLTWAEHPLTRPQTELVAATVTSINECFY